MLIRSSAFKHSTEQFLYIFSTSFNLPSPPKIALNNQISEWDGWARINYLPRGFSGMCLPLFTHNFETDTSGEIFSIPLWPHAGKKANPWDLQQSIRNHQGNVLTWKIWFEKIFAHSRWGNVSNNLNRSHHPFKILKIKAIRMTNEVFFYCKNKCINKSSTKIKARCSYTDVINNICNWNRMTVSPSKGKVLQRPERLP